MNYDVQKYPNDFDRIVARQEVTNFENEVLKKFEQIDIPIKHYFSKGLYAREMTMPTNAVVVGHIHKYEQLNILSKGEVTLVTEEGPIRIKAPYTFAAKAGSKRLFHAHEESVWTVILATEETDIELIEKHFIAKTEDEYLEFCNANQLALPI